MLASRARRWSHGHVGASRPTLYRDRADAGRVLAEELGADQLGSDSVVLGLPRGGVPVAAPIADKQYLVDHVGINDEAFHGEYWRGSGACSAPAARRSRRPTAGSSAVPGSRTGSGLGDTNDIELGGIGRTPFQDSRPGSGPTRAWPDGNISLLRLAVSKLIPNAFPNGGGAPGPAERPQGRLPLRPSSTSRAKSSGSGSTAPSTTSSAAERPRIHAGRLRGQRRRRDPQVPGRRQGHPRGRQGT